MKKLIRTIRSLAASLTPIAAVLFFTNVLLAQGPIFTGDASNLSNIIREALKLMAIILFCLGAVGVAWAIYNKMTGKEWGNQAFGSRSGTLTAVVWTLLIRKSACTLGRSLRIVNYPRIVNNAFRAAG